MTALVDTLETKGFVGVKLYPSLGYSIDDAVLVALYDHCDANGIPITVHHGEGGFYYSKDSIEFARPDRWGGHE